MAEVSEKAYTRDEVGHALNAACDDILDAVDAPDEGVRDALNLLVNAALAYLDGSADDLDGVVASNYGEATLGEIVGWIRNTY